MTVRELINKLMDMDLDKPIYITEFANIDDNVNNMIGFINSEPIKLSNFEIAEVDIHGVYNAFFNCITIKSK